MEDRWVITLDPWYWDGIEMYPTLQEAQDRKAGYMDDSGLRPDAPERANVHIYRIVFEE